MSQKYFTLLLVSVAWLGMSGCGSSSRSPAPVLKLGVNPDSVTGYMRVAPKDTLYSISKRYKLSRQDIIDLNGLKPPYTLALGQRLKLRHTPEIIFKLDESVEYSIHISEVLDKIKDKGKADEREKGN